MAALTDSRNVRSVLSFEKRLCSSSWSRSPVTMAILDHSRKFGKQCSVHSLTRWVYPRGVDKSRMHHRRLTIRAAEEGSFLRSIGTPFFKADRKESAPPERDPVVTAPFGTQFFKLGGGEQTPKEEITEEPRTGLFKFGTRRREARTQVGTTNGTALTVRRGSTGLESLPFGRGRRVDPKTVFVAGATGQIGARISQQLLRAGFTVRAGVPDLYVAQQLAEFAIQYGVISRDEAKRLNAVEFDFKNVSSIAKALGNAGKVVVTIGPTEDGPRGKVSTVDALLVLEAAALSNSAHFVVVTETGTGLAPDDNPLAGLTALFSRVFGKVAEISDSDLIDRIVETGLTYTVVKAGSTDGMDDYAPECGSLVVEAEGASDPRAKVSKIQVATVVAGVFLYTGVSENKFFEVASSPYAPSRPVEELFSEIQVDGRREILEEERTRRSAEEREKEVRSRAESEAYEAIEEARRAAQLAAQLDAEAKKLAAEEARASAVATKAQARAEAAAASVDGLQVKAKELGANPLRSLSGRLGTMSFKPGAKVKKPAPEKQRTAVQPVPVSASSTSKPSGFFGGLFAPQESIYIDDD